MDVWKWAHYLHELLQNLENLPAREVRYCVTRVKSLLKNNLILDFDVCLVCRDLK